MLLNDTILRAIIHERRISQTELAKTANLSRSTVAGVCNGKSCSGDSALAIAAALNIPLEILIRR